MTIPKKNRKLIDYSVFDDEAAEKTYKPKYRYKKSNRYSPYQMMVGIYFKAVEYGKRAIKFAVRNINKLMIAITFLGMVLAGQAYDSEMINFNVTVLFELVLTILAVTLIRLEIHRENN